MNVILDNSVSTTWTTSPKNLDFFNLDSNYLKSSEVLLDKFQTGHHRLLVSSQDFSIAMCIL